MVGGTAPYTYSWDFGDDSSGESGNDDDIAHTFEEAGTYSVDLTVTDSSGQSASDSVDITVDEPAAAATVADDEEEEVVEEEQPPAEEEEVEEQPPAEEEEEDNDSDSDDEFDVDGFVDNLLGRLGVR